MQPTEQNSASDQPYSRILKSTTIIGGSSAINVIFRIIQAKVVAVLIGPTGVGLMGLFNSVLGVAGTISGMGLAMSGVRQIAEAAGSGDVARISRTVTAFRYLALFFGLVGGIVLFAFRHPVARLTFGSEKFAPALGWLAIALLLITISSAQSSFVRGMQRVGDLARMSVLGIAIGTLAGIPLLYFFRENGIAPYLIFSAVTTVVVSWWYARKIPLAKVSVTWRDISSESRALLSLGGAFMVTGLATMATTYLVKVVVTRQLGLDSAGLFEASSQLSNVYVGFILGAMSTDFFPHLASVSNDQKQSSQLINAQAEIGVLLATPGILAILALGSFVLQLLYSANFTPAYEILRWQALGTFLRVISWPIGFLLLASRKGKIYLFTELTTNLVYLGGAAFCISRWGISGVGIAFFVMYGYYVALMTLIARGLINFHWSERNIRIVAAFIPVILTAFLTSFLLPKMFSVVISLGLTLGVGIYSCRAIYKLIGPATAQSYWKRVKNRFGWSKT